MVKKFLRTFLIAGLIGGVTGGECAELIETEPRQSPMPDVMVGWHRLVTAAGDLSPLQPDGPDCRATTYRVASREWISWPAPIDACCPLRAALAPLICLSMCPLVTVKYLLCDREPDYAGERLTPCGPCLGTWGWPHGRHDVIGPDDKPSGKLSLEQRCGLYEDWILEHSAAPDQWIIAREPTIHHTDHASTGEAVPLQQRLANVHARSAQVQLDRNEAAKSWAQTIVRQLSCKDARIPPRPTPGVNEAAFYAGFTYAPYDDRWTGLPRSGHESPNTTHRRSVSPAKP